jgi:hypothetical protein
MGCWNDPVKLQEKDYLIAPWTTGLGHPHLFDSDLFYSVSISTEPSLTTSLSTVTWRVNFQLTSIEIYLS